MIPKALRLVSLIATAVLVLSFVLFAVDESHNGSNQQLARLSSDGLAASGAARGSATNANIDAPNPPPAVKRERARRHGALREKLDEADDLLLSPFTTIVHSKSIWLERSVPFLLALLIFGFGLRLIANYAVGVTRPA